MANREVSPTGSLRFAALLGALALGACVGDSAGAGVAAEARALAERLPRASMTTPPRAPVSEYPIHEDGGIVYDPLRREAESTGQLRRYAKVPSTPVGVALGPYRLRAAVPRSARAYDVVPIDYELSWRPSAEATFPVAVEAVAFEEEGRRRGRPACDLALPGRIDLAVEYLGSVTAHLDPGPKQRITPDLSDKPGSYPGFRCGPLARSGVVEAGDLVWYRVCITNTGNTILDAEGLGGCLLYPRLLRRGASGAYEPAGESYNLYVRDLEYLYPGESHDLWLHCTGSVPGFAEPPGAPTPQGFGVVPGDYRLQLRLIYRHYGDADPFRNIWEGATGFVWEMPFTVEERARQAPVLPGETVLTDGPAPDKLTRFIHTFEEFMTAFDCHISPTADGARRVRGRLHLQVAPWTREVVLRLVQGSPSRVADAAAPLRVSLAGLRLRRNDATAFTIRRDGRVVPVVESQTMADMRTNVQLGPYPGRHIAERLREMAECGINVVATTSMPWLYNDMHGTPSNYQGDAWKYVLDVARDQGMGVEGWGTYPFDRSTCGPIAEWLTGRPAGLTQFALGGACVSHADPALPAANAALWLYQFRRWGDLYYENARGEVPISVEDTRGWMRQDVNIRYPMGPQTVAVFREWLRLKYGDIATLNQAWGTAFADFEAIDPERDQVRNQFGHLWEYTDPANPFHDWSTAVTDLDVFRSELRLANYADTLALVREAIPGAVVALRTEGANVLVAGLDPADPNPHVRHAYLSQRRCGAIAELLGEAGTVRVHSDYTTIPYTPTELRRFVHAAVAQGITPAYFPQFDNMRDIAVNARYGTDYQVHYNLPEPRKGYMMHCLTAAYPWLAVTYEEGGIPGILWEDYQCDGFATETQKREMRLFAAELGRVVEAGQSLDAAPDDAAWRARATPLRAYRTR